MSFFSLQCSPVVNGSVIPDVSGILRTIRSLDINKALGHDDISIRMLKIRDYRIFEPLKILLMNSVNQAVFPSRWKKADVIPFHK